MSGMNTYDGRPSHDRSESGNDDSSWSDASRGSWSRVKEPHAVNLVGESVVAGGSDERGLLIDRPSSARSVIDSPSEHGSSRSSADDPWRDGEESKSSGYLILLTTCMLGLQVAWSVEMASVSPFLLSLGLSKSLLALVWIAGPLSGTLVQPYVGIRSDNCRLAYGRRRPFMIWGTAATMGSLLALSWTREIVATVVGIFGVSIPSGGTSPFYQVFAVALIYILDFAINVIQAAVRAFIVDCTPTHQQETANAWASRVSGIGHISAYLVGFVYLPGIFPWLGDTQFKVFVALACIVMASTMTISCLSTKERDPRSLGTPSDSSGGVFAFFRSLFSTIRTLPPQVKQVCVVQLWAWIGWFPFLFYITTYIGGLYAEPYFTENPNMTDEQINDIWEKGTRIGTLALLVFAVVTFMSSVFLPLIIPPTYTPAASHLTQSTPLSSSPGATRNPDYFTSPKPSASTHSRPSRLRHLLSASHLQISTLTLRRAWILSHVVFFILTWLTLFVRTPFAGTILVGLIGVPWALTNWAPFALIAAEISRRDVAKRGVRRSSATVAPIATSAPLSAGPSTAISHHPMSSSSTTDLEGAFHDPVSPSSQLPPMAHADDTTSQAGILLGIHNVAISAPQVVATLVSSVMFRALQKPRGTPGDDSVGWVLRFGGCCALVAAWVCRRVEENRRR